VTATTIDLVLPRLHPGQLRVAAEARRFNVLACGRRWGKTTFGIDRLVHPALEGYPVAWFAPTYKMLQEAWRELRATLLPVTARSDSQEHRLELVTGGVVDMWSLTDPNTARGRKYKRVFVDEAAMIAELEEAWYAVIRPTLTDYAGDAWFGSTPKGLNFFHTLFEWGEDPLKPAWAAWQMPTTANPHISPAEVDEARGELPEDTFDQEYAAAFRQNAGAVFRNVDACLRAPEASPADHRGHAIVLGADWAQKEDFTVFSVGCADCRVELALERFNQLDWAIQRQNFGIVCDRWAVKDAMIETNSIGGPNLEALAEAGYPVRGFETTASSKGPLIRSLKLSFEREEFQFLPGSVGRNELLSYEVKIDPATGRPRYSAPPGKHDDTVIARALLRHAAEMTGPAIGDAAAQVWAR
jgi:hypothetical protein